LHAQDAGALSPASHTPMIMTTELARTPLYDWHVAHGGRMVDFAGWSMPVQYTSITEEHLATRNVVGVFDISHMGRLQFYGPGAADFLDHMVTRRVSDMRLGQIRYALVCNEEGGILDDVLVYRLNAQDAGDDAPEFQAVVNASNRPKIVEWFSRRAPDFAVRMADATRSTVMFAVQGPRTMPAIEHLVVPLRYYHGAQIMFESSPICVSRTGYTGEDGFEFICGAEHAQSLWERLFKLTADVGAVPVGLGARDTLRLEAAMPLYGHELSEEINPIQAGLDFAVNFGDRDFVGRAALEQAAGDPNQQVRVGLQLDGKRVPRQGCPVMQGDDHVGEVTSGTYSPTLERPIAMAYVRPAAQAPGTQLSVDIRGTQHAAVVVPLPFYQRRH
jgi:aminomethyltransferase